MRAVLAAVLMLAALAQAWVDWRATIGAGFAYRLTPIDRALADLAPQTTARMIEAWRTTGVPYLWDPIGAVLTGLPLALVLGVAAVLLWVTRRRGR